MTGEQVRKAYLRAEFVLGARSVAYVTLSKYTLDFSAKYFNGLSALVSYGLVDIRSGRYGALDSYRLSERGISEINRYTSLAEERLQREAAAANVHAEELIRTKSALFARPPVRTGPLYEALRECIGVGVDTPYRIDTDSYTFDHILGILERSFYLGIASNNHGDAPSIVELVTAGFGSLVRSKRGPAYFVIGPEGAAALCRAVQRGETALDQRRKERARRRSERLQLGQGLVGRNWMELLPPEVAAAQQAWEGRRIAKRMLDLGFSREQVGDRLSITGSTVKLWNRQHIREPMAPLTRFLGEDQELRDYARHIRIEERRASIEG